jgi:hypothetical protein
MTTETLKGLFRARCPYEGAASQFDCELALLCPVASDGPSYQAKRPINLTGSQFTEPRLLMMLRLRQRRRVGGTARQLHYTSDATGRSPELRVITVDQRSVCVGRLTMVMHEPLEVV